jgi:MFS family permease
MILALFLFVNPRRAAEMDPRSWVSAGLVTEWGIAYMLACPFVGRLVTSRNAARLMIGSCVAIALLCGAFALVGSIAAMYLLLPIGGVASAVFFVSFQVFMRAVDSAREKTVSYSTGLYTFAWSAGYAVGPFVSGFLMETGPDGWKLCYLVAGVSALLTGLGIWFLSHHAHGPAEAPPEPPPRDARPPIDYAKLPNLAWLGWVGAGVATLVMALILGLLPSLCVKLHMTAAVQGGIFFVIAFSRALVGLVLMKSRMWMYRATAVGAFGLLGLAGVLAFGFWQGSTGFYVAAVCYGVFSAAFYFYLVFHALTHPDRAAHNVSVNESVVGVGYILGPAIGALIVRAFEGEMFGFTVAFAAGAALLLAAIAFQVVMHRKHAVAESPARG